MVIPRSLLTRIHSHLQAGYPNEACGVILGRSGAATEVVAANNARPGSARNRYLIDPLVYMKIERDADRRGLQVLGIYHSHPDAAAHPSPFDLDNAWPNLVYLIVSVVQGRAAEATAWRLRDDRNQFDPEPVEIPD
jgi:proteasome lid subunit RPN8/RPN11